MNVTKIQFQIKKYSCGREVPYRFMIWDEKGCHNEWYFIHSPPCQNGEMPDYWLAERLPPIYINKQKSWVDSHTYFYLNDKERNSVQYNGISENKNYLCYANFNKGHV